MKRTKRKRKKPPEWHLSKSKLRSYEFCNRKFFFEYILGLEGYITSEKQDVMDVGWLFHDETACFHKQLVKRNDFRDVDDAELLSYFKSCLRKKVDEVPYMEGFLEAEVERLLELRNDDREDIFLPVLIEHKFKLDELDMMGYVDRLYETYDGEYCVQEIKPLVKSWNISNYRRELYFYKEGIEAEGILDKPIKNYHVLEYKKLPLVECYSSFHWRTRNAYNDAMKRYRTGVTSGSFDRTVRDSYACNLKCEFFPICWMDWHVPVEHPIIQHSRLICEKRGWGNGTI